MGRLLDDTYGLETISIRDSARDSLVSVGSDSPGPSHAIAVAIEQWIPTKVNRYNIVSESDLADAALKIEAGRAVHSEFIQSLPTQSKQLYAN